MFRYVKWNWNKVLKVFSWHVSDAHHVDNVCRLTLPFTRNSILRSVGLFEQLAK